MERANEMARGSPLELRAANKLIRLSVSMDMTSTTTPFRTLRDPMDSTRDSEEG